MSRIAWSSLLALVVGCSPAEGQQSGGAQGRPDDGAERAPAPEASARRVEVATLRPTDARLELRLPGEVEGSRDALLASALGGFVERVAVDNGAQVRRGQVLVQVDATTHRARVAQAQVEREAAERELRRAEGLGTALPRAQLEGAQSRHAAALAAHRTASVMASRAVIKAPFDGVVSGLAVDVGEVAPPGAPVLRLVALDPVKVTISASDRDVVALREGMEAVVTTDAQGARHAGRVVHVDPAADLRTRAFTVEIEVPNPDRLLLPGMIATVWIEEGVATGQLIVPQDFIVTRREGLGVFVDEGGVARWQEVTLGQVVRDQVVVASGLAQGQRIVVVGHRELADGDALLVAREGVCCTAGRVVHGEQ